MIYEPAEDSFLLSSVLKKYAKGKSVLDMGTGSGILAESAIKAEAKIVVAVDCNAESVKLVKKKGIDSYKSDLFSKVKGTFDIIVCNPPYLPEDNREDSESALITSGGKKGDEFIIKFLSHASKFLNKSGIILLLISSLTPQKNILSIVKKKSLVKKVVTSQNLFMEKLEVWLISSSHKSLRKPL